MQLLLKIFLSLVCWSVFAYVILQIPYPDSLTQANSIQMLSFFVPLFLALIFTLNLILKNVLSSGSISLGLIFLLVIKALDSLNLVTAVLIIISVGLLLSYFSKIKKRGLTSTSKIPKLTSLQPKVELQRRKQ